MDEFPELTENTTEITVSKRVSPEGTQVIEVNGESFSWTQSRNLTGTTSENNKYGVLTYDDGAEFVFGAYRKEIKFEDSGVSFDKPVGEIADNLAMRIAKVRKWVQTCRYRTESATVSIPTL